MASALHDLHLLSNFSLSSRHRLNRKGKGVAFGERSHVCAAQSIVPSQEAGEVALAVQGDGIHVYELSEYHKVSSIATGPSASFLSPPASVIRSEAGSEVRRTFVASQNQDSPEADGDTLTMWKEPVSSSSSSSRESKQAELRHRCASLFLTHDSSSVIAYSADGSITRLSPELDELEVFRSSAPQHVVKLFVLPRKLCAFVPTSIPSNGILAVAFYHRDEHMFIRIDAFYDDVRNVIVDECEIPLSNAEDIVDVTFDSSGHVSVLGSSAAWISFRLECRNDSIAIGSSSNTSWLDNLTFIGKQPIEARPFVSILSLSSSFAMLAGVSNTKDTILLLVDTQYGVVLHSLAVPTPSHIAKASSLFSVCLERGSASQVLLIFSSEAEGEAKGQQRSSVFVVPFAVPERSTIANAMKNALVDSPWILNSLPVIEDESDDAVEKRRLLDRMQSAIEENKPLDADTAFFRWSKPREVQEVTKEKTNSDEEEEEDVQSEKAETDTKIVTFKRLSPKGPLNHDFISQVLSLVLQVNEPKKQSYSPKICRFLISKRIVAQSMVTGGLVQALAAVDDWEALRECFLNVPDITENDALDVIRLILKHDDSRQKDVVESMDVDATPIDDEPVAKPVSGKSIPPLRTILAYVVNYPSSIQAWRLAINKYTGTVEDLLALMGVMEEWLKVYESKDLQLSLGEIKMNDQGVPVPKLEYNKKLERVKGMLLPPLDKVLAFLQALLDSSFLKLIQEPSALPLLQRISDLIRPHVQVNTDLEALRGPLAPFDRARAQAVAAAKEWKNKKDNVDWRKRRRQEQEQAALALGPYQVEELIF